MSEERIIQKAAYIDWLNKLKFDANDTAHYIQLRKIADLEIGPNDFYDREIIVPYSFFNSVASALEHIRSQNGEVPDKKMSIQVYDGYIVTIALETEID